MSVQSARSPPQSPAAATAATTTLVASTRHRGIHESLHTSLARPPPRDCTTVCVCVQLLRIDKPIEQARTSERADRRDGHGWTQTSIARRAVRASALESSRAGRARFCFGASLAS